MADVVLFGIGKAADTAFRYLLNDSDHKVCAFTVDRDYLEVDEFHGLPAVAFEDVQELYPPSRYEMLVFLGFQGMNKMRYEKYMQAKDKGYRFISYISSDIKFIEEPQIGENCFIFDKQSINLDVSIGNNVIMWSGNHIGDRSVIGDNCWITSHVCISGDVVVEPFCFFGINSAISNNVKVRQRTFVGANAVISQDTDEDGVYIVPGAPKGAFTSERFLQMAKID